MAGTNNPYLSEEEFQKYKRKLMAEAARVKWKASVQMDQVLEILRRFVAGSRSDTPDILEVVSNGLAALPEHHRLAIESVLYRDLNHLLLVYETAISDTLGELAAGEEGTSR